MKKLFTLFILAMSMSVYAQESVLLRLNYQKGDKYRVKAVMKQTMSMMTNNIEAVSMQEVVGIKGDKTTLNSTTDKFVMDMNKMGQAVHYDSSMDEKEMDQMAKTMHTQMKPYITSTFSVTYDNLGNIMDAKLVKGTGNLEQFKQGLSVGTVYPKEAVKVGSQWTDKNNINGFDYTKTYTVDKIDKNFVYVKVLVKISGMGGTGTGDGMMKIDKNTGLMVSATSKNTISAMGQEIKTEATITNTKL